MREEKVYGFLSLLAAGHTPSMQKPKLPFGICVAVHLLYAEGGGTKKAYGDERGSFERLFIALLLRIKKKTLIVLLLLLGQNCPRSLKPDPFFRSKAFSRHKIMGKVEEGRKTCCLLNSNMIDCLDRARESVNQSCAN